MILINLYNTVKGVLYDLARCQTDAVWYADPFYLEEPANDMIHGSVWGKRSMQPVRSRSRRRCSCGCKKRATHLGLGDGVALIQGCELYVRRWVRDGIAMLKSKANGEGINDG